MKVICKVCGRLVGTRTTDEKEIVIVKHRTGRSPHRLRTVIGTRGHRDFSEHRPIDRVGDYEAKPVCSGTGNIGVAA